MPHKDQIVDENRFLVIPRSLIFIFNADKVLLIKGAAEKKIWANRYNGLGGHIERGEDIKSAALRELSEEAGLVSIDIHLAGTVMINTGKQFGICIYIFTGEYNGEKLIPSAEGLLEWVRIAQINSINTVEDLPVLIENILANRATGQLLYGRYYYDDQDKLVMAFN